MYNTSTALIDISIKSNGTVIHSLSVPYDLMSAVENIYRLEDITTVSSILGQEYLVTTPPNYVPLNPTTGPHPVLTIYETIQSFKADEEAVAESLLRSQIYTEHIEGNPNVDEEMQLRMRPTEVQLAELMQKQQNFIDQMQAEHEAQAMQADLDRVQAVRSIAMDPTRCVEFLLTPVGHTGDVQRQMAASIANNVEYCTQIVASTASLWINSYDLMNEFAKMAYSNSEFAQLFYNQLPEDSVTRNNLERLGLVN